MINCAKWRALPPQAPAAFMTNGQSVRAVLQLHRQASVCLRSDAFHVPNPCVCPHRCVFQCLLTSCDSCPARGMKSASRSTGRLHAERTAFQAATSCYQGWRHCIGGGLCKARRKKHWTVFMLGSSAQVHHDGTPCTPLYIVRPLWCFGEIRGRHGGVGRTIGQQGKSNERNK